MNKSLTKKLSLLQLIALLVGSSLFMPLAFAQSFSSLSVNHDPFNPYSADSSSVTLTYNLDNQGQAAHVQVGVYAASDMSTPIKTWNYNNQASGTYNQPSWDGKGNGGSAVAPGQYIFKLSGLAGTTTIPPEQVSFNVQYAYVNNLTVSNDPFDPTAGSVDFGYTLNSEGITSDVTVGVYASTDLNTALKSWNFTDQTTGQNKATWDGKLSSGNVAPDGSYVFKVSGSSSDGGVIQSQQKSFSLQSGSSSTTTSSTTSSTTSTSNTSNTSTTSTSNQSSATRCAGFTDVNINDPNCPAITYVKSIGAMTGNPDGTFAPNSLLQRDQVAKIVLQTFNKFDQTVDYCQGVNPFPDVTQNDWSYQYICRGKQLGMITGYQGGADAGYYRPARSVNRAEFLALLLRNLSGMPTTFVPNYDDVPLGQWYTVYGKYSYDNNLFPAPNLYPTNFTLRVEVAKVIYHLHNLGKI